MLQRRSREGAWIEMYIKRQAHTLHPRRSREGAWIEINCHTARQKAAAVAPVRERGLKYAGTAGLPMAAWSLP